MTFWIAVSLAVIAMCAASYGVSEWLIRRSVSGGGRGRGDHGRRRAPRD